MMGSVRFLFLLFFPAMVIGQIGNESEKDSTGAEIPKAIAVVDIVQSVEEAHQEIVQSARKIGKSHSVQEIDSLFPEFEKFLKHQIERKDQFVKANPNRQKINNLIKKWDGYYAQLNRWGDLINENEERNLIVRDLLEFKENVWQLTYENAVKEEVPLELLTSVRVIWNDYKKLNKQITEENNEFLVQESEINNQKLLVTGVVEELNELKNSEIYDLFYLRHKPLWKASFKSPDKDLRDDDEVESVSDNITAIINYFKTNENKFYLFFMIIGLITAIILFLKKAFEKYPFNEEDMDLQNAKDIIMNRAVVSILFLIVVIAYWSFTNTPMLFNNILVLLALILAVPLVKPYMYKRFKKIIYFVIVLYVLDSAKTYMWFSSTQYRLYLLFEAILVAIVLAGFTHPYLQTRKIKIGKFGMFLIRLTPVVYGLLLISIFSNILGYTNLADLTLKISTQSGVITVSFYGILLVAEGISTGYLHWHFNNSGSFDHERKFKLELKLLGVIRILAFLAWILIFLNTIDLLRPLTLSIQNFLEEPYRIGSITITLGEVFNFILILLVAYVSTSFISYLFSSGDVSIKIFKLPKGVPAAISLVIRYMIMTFGIVLALSSLGVDLSKFNLMAGALGLGIGFGLQTVVSNFISGLILVFERPIHQGDTVEVNNLLGRVKRIGVRSSSIVTYDGAEVVVPNNNLIANDLINWTLSDSVRRVEILIGTAYGSDPNKVLEILLDVAKGNEYTLKYPEPLALFDEFGDSSLNFKLRYWVHYEVGLISKSEISIGIYNEFAKNGIEIPFPQQDVYIKDMPAFEKKIDENNADQPEDPSE